MNGTQIKGLWNLAQWLRRASEARQCVAGQSLAQRSPKSEKT